LHTFYIILRPTNCGHYEFISVGTDLIVLLCIQVPTDLLAEAKTAAKEAQEEDMDAD